MKDRIRKIIDTEQLSQSEFAEKVGVQRSNISHILAGRNKPSVDFIQKLLQNFDNLNSEWVLMGIGEMYKNNTEQPEIQQDNNNVKPKTKQQEINYSAKDDTSKQEPITEQSNFVNPDNNTVDLNNNTILSTPEQVLVLFDDQTFITYKKR